MAVNSDGELNQRSLDNTLSNAILTGDGMAIRNILKTCSADSPLHSPLGFLGNSHSQHVTILPIHLAAIHRKVQSLETLLHSGADPERRDHNGCNALHLVITHWPKSNGTRSEPRSKFAVATAAAERRAEACLRSLCSFGVDVNARVASDSGDTAMHLAVRYGALPAVAILADHGAQVNAADRLGMLPLHMAAGTLNADMAASLIRHGAEVNRATRQSGATPLHMAVLALACKTARVRPQDLSCVGELLARGAAPHVRNKEGRTPLHEACRHGQEEAADMLLGCGAADANVRTSSGENCLFLFLDRTANLQRASLMGKLLGLTYPLAITNGQGALPGTLLLPEHRAQKDMLLELCRQPLNLKETCRVHIHRQYGEKRRRLLKDILPERLHSFVYRSWECSFGILFPGTRHIVDHETPEDLPGTPGDTNTVEERASIGYN